MNFWNENVSDVLKKLDSSKQGLSASEAQLRLQRDGKNLLHEEKKAPWIILFLLQFKNVMTIILIIAAVLSSIFSGVLEAVIIFAVVLLNAIIGVVQESKAEKAIDALKKLSAATAKVRRDGVVMAIASEDIVAGDIIILEAGDSIPCDIRLMECHSLKIEEAALTGESVASEKAVSTVAVDAPLGDRKNMAFMGTNVTYGRGEGVACGTGMNTQMGSIAGMLTDAKKEQTPLEKKINSIGKLISIGILIICAVIFGIKMLYNIGNAFTADIIIEGLLSAVSLAVAAIPEGLTAVITLVMAMGVTRMSKQGAIIRKLPSIETLGCAEIICSDKTGTITQNKMTVVETYTLGEAKADYEELVLTSVLCNDSHINNGVVTGDPTETALVTYAINKGYDAQTMIAKNARVGEVPFDSVRKLMSTVNITADGEKKLYVKGATDELLSKCKGYMSNGKIVPLTDSDKQKILAKNADMAKNALRVLGFAYRDKKNDDANIGDEAYLVFVGLMGMIDPVRPEVPEAVRKCFKAGMSPIMITGDHLVTATAIGKELGIIKDESQAISGKEIDKLSDEEFEKVLDKYRVYARVSPENKVRIVKFWKARGKICAMTGDGVNDAPAIKTANIGIGMGITGTDVTKNVADMVLNDDNFATIVIAVEEGRKIFDNIKKTVQFLLSTNVCEVLTLFIATLCGINILKAAQILWVNLVTDTVPALGLGVEPAEKNIMSRPPTDSKKGLFAGHTGFKIVYQSIIMSGLVLSSFFIGRQIGNNEVAMTMAFGTLSLVQVFHSFNLKSLWGTIINKNFFENKILAFGGLGSIAVTIILIYLPFVNDMFSLTPLSLVQLAVTFGLSFAIIPLVELVKLFSKIFFAEKIK